MSAVAFLQRLTPLLRDVFDNDDLIVTPELTAKEVEGWDSLGNVRLFLEIEREFSVRFTATEVTAPKTLGQLVELIEAKPLGVAL